MKNQEFSDKIKEDISKIYDVKEWTFFFNKKGGLEFYKSNPMFNWIYESDFSNYDEDIKSISERIEGHYRLKIKKYSVTKP